MSTNSPRSIFSDILLISDFGRSGQGWVSYMLSYIFNARFIEPYVFLMGRSYSHYANVITYSRGSLPDREATSIKLVVKTHELPSNGMDLTDKIILLTRDPRDVAVSYATLLRKWRRDNGWSPGIVALSLPFFGNLLIARRWARHFRSWKEFDVYHVRYEDMINDGANQLQRIADHFGLPANKTLISEAISHLSFEKSYGRPRGVEEKNNPDARKGIVGDWHNHFSPLMNAAFWRICGKEAEACGYRKNGAILPLR